MMEVLQEKLKVVLTQWGRNSHHQNWRRFGGFDLHINQSR